MSGCGRRALGLREGDQLKLSVKRGAIILRPERVVTAKELRGILDPVKVKSKKLRKPWAGSCLDMQMPFVVPRNSFKYRSKFSVLMGGS